MKAVSSFILTAINQLQALPHLKEAALGGGTNLALRYNHRISVDIDLFFSDIIGKNGFNGILADVVNCFGAQAVQGVTFPCNIDDQFVFLRFFLFLKKETIKVEIIQNMHFVDEQEMYEDVRLLSVRDIGLFKLMSACNRVSNKDIYDLDYVTEQILLIDLLHDLALKEQKFNKESDRTIFDLDHEKSPVNFPELLLKFDEPGKTSSNRPTHSHHRIDTLEGSKNWRVARSSWRRKVRHHFTLKGIPFPSLTGQ